MGRDGVEDLGCTDPDRLCGFSIDGDAAFVLYKGHHDVLVVLFNRL